MRSEEEVSKAATRNYRVNKVKVGEDWFRTIYANCALGVDKWGCFSFR